MLIRKAKSVTADEMSTDESADNQKTEKEVINVAVK